MHVAVFRRLRLILIHRPFGDRALWLVPLLSLIAFPAPLAGANGPHGSVDLVADQAFVRAGRPFRVGLHFQLEPGWHTYWVNPGDSGQPPRVKWTLPTGFQSGPLEWPVPQRIEDHSLVDYGYQNDVLLPVEITPPAELRNSAKVQLLATVNWLVCRDICVPARADLILTLPVRADTSGTPSPQHSLFAQSRTEVPLAAPHTWKATASLDARQITLTVITGKRESDAAFFPLEANQIENAAPQKASAIAGGVQIELQRSDQMLKPPARLRGLLVFPSRQGYVIEAPVVSK